jgi:hypothetical protein
MNELVCAQDMGQLAPRIYVRSSKKRRNWILVWLHVASQSTL